jgi:two-component system, NarL family, nitrate/nitrite response regulator NarL
VEAGARGYVLRGASIDNLRIAVESIARGETVCSPQITYSMFSRLAELAHHAMGAQTILTTREMEILQLISQGWSNKRIANHLFVSLYTVKNHVHNILKKLQVQHRLEAVAYAYQRYWLKGTRPAAGEPLGIGAREARAERGGDMPC